MLFQASGRLTMVRILNLIYKKILENIKLISISFVIIFCSFSTNNWPGKSMFLLKNSEKDR